MFTKNLRAFWVAVCLNVFFVVNAFGVTCCAAGDLVLADDGESKYVIVLCENPIEAEVNAADQLRKHLNLITGSDFAIVKADAKCDKAKIFVGAGEAVKKDTPEVNWDQMTSDDRIIIKVVGGDLILAGSKPRGSLYAVYSFLEDTIGCRWWTSTESFIPSKSKLTISSSLDIDYSPSFKKLRNTYYGDVFASPEFCAKLRCLYPKFYNRGEKWGGGVTFNGYHTFFKLIPPEEYFDEHPDWYSMIRGKRTHVHGQLCMTSEGLLAEMIKKAKAILAEDPESIVVINQEDLQGDSRCTCPKCLAIEEVEGSPSGPIVHFVNKVAEAIEKDYPNGRVMTFAYLYSQKPPKVVKPRKNVIIWLCSFNATRWYPLASKMNETFNRDLKKWSDISSEIFIWDYRSNYHNYMEIYPNLETLESDIRFFADNKVVGLFEQGDRFCEIGDFVALRAWMTAHLLWNPELKQADLTREFMNGYYGAAGPVLIDYLKLVNNSGMFVGKGKASPEPAILLKAAKLYQKAFKAVEGDKVLTDRVVKARTSLETSTLQLSLLGADVDDVIKALGYKDQAGLLAEFKRKCLKYKTNRYKEGGADAELPYLAARYEKLANEPKITPVIDGVDFDKATWVSIQESSLGSYCSVPAKYVDDKLASNGRAARMDGNRANWNNVYAFQAGLLKACGIKKVSIYLRARVVLDNTYDAKVNSDEVAFTFGIYNAGTKQELMRHVKNSEIKGSGYQYYCVDRDVDASCSVVVVADGKQTKELFIDGLVLVKPQ